MKRRMASLLALLLLAASLPTATRAAEEEPTGEDIPAVTESPLLPDMAAEPTMPPEDTSTPEVPVCLLHSTVKDFAK